jgi:hypothetical protein
MRVTRVSDVLQYSFQSVTLLMGYEKPVERNQVIEDVFNVRIFSMIRGAGGVRGVKPPAHPGHFPLLFEKILMRLSLSRDDDPEDQVGYQTRQAAWQQQDKKEQAKPSWI